MTTTPKKRRVVVIDDSGVAREVLRGILEAEGDLTVVGEAGDGESAAKVVSEHAPDLVTMDIEMPGAGGLAAIEQIMARCPTPILVVTGLPVGSEGGLVFEAVRRGALDVAEKPCGGDVVAESRLRAHVRRLAGLPVVRHMRGLREAPPPAGVPRAPVGRRRCRVVGIASSAGGPAALAAVLSSLPKAFPACIAVVQHLPVGFAETFARFLGSTTPLPVSVVDGRADAAPGRVLVAGDDRHLVAASAEAFVASDEPPVGGHRPSANPLFRSLARIHGHAAVGVVLSGIGDDGVAGLADMHAQGALTISQDAKTCAVYGMPAAAVQAGAVERTLAVDAIAPALIQATEGRE